MKIKKATRNVCNDNNNNNNDSNDDSLETWLECIKFALDDDDNSKINTEITLSLLERCTKSIMMNHQEHHQDERILHAHIRHADRTLSPIDMHTHLRKNKIDVSNSLI